MVKIEFIVGAGVRCGEEIRHGIGNELGKCILMRMIQSTCVTRKHSRSTSPSVYRVTENFQSD